MAVPYALLYVWGICSDGLSPADYIALCAILGFTQLTSWMSGVLGMLNLLKAKYDFSFEKTKGTTANSR
jgi:hypothetical protein